MPEWWAGLPREREPICLRSLCQVCSALPWPCAKAVVVTLWGVQRTSAPTCLKPWLRASSECLVHAFCNQAPAMRARSAARPRRWSPTGACTAGNALRPAHLLQKRRRRVWGTLEVRMVRSPPPPLLGVSRAPQAPTVPRSQVLLHSFLAYTPA